MSSPGDGAVQARVVLREDARRIVGRGFRIDLGGVDEAVGGGVGRVEGLVGRQALGDAGWGLLFVGVLMLRDDGLLVPSAARDDRMLGAGLSYGAFVAASAGDVLLGRSEADVGAEASPGARWSPAAEAEAALQMASRLSADVVASVMAASQARQFEDMFCERLRREVSGIDDAYAGWGLSVFGAWLGSSAQQVAAPVGRSRVLGRPNAGAQTGCALAGALLTRVGCALLGV